MDDDSSDRAGMPDDSDDSDETGGRIAKVNVQYFN